MKPLLFDWAIELPVWRNNYKVVPRAIAQSAREDHIQVQLVNMVSPHLPIVVQRGSCLEIRDSALAWTHVH
jgi:hypothetical protein